MPIWDRVAVYSIALSLFSVCDNAHTSGSDDQQTANPMVWRRPPRAGARSMTSDNPGSFCHSDGNGHDQEALTPPCTPENAPIFR